MFGWLRKVFRARGPAGVYAGRARPFVRARYDAAQTTDENRRHWANADGLSADAAASPEVRRILRNRARYEVANNSYAKGIVLTLANDVVGTGPRLQMLMDDDEANRLIEYEFARWAKSVRLAEKLRAMRMARATDGEAFLIFGSNLRLPGDVKLDVRLIEADQVTTPNLSPLDVAAVDGIVFDSWGNPLEYHVLKSHPGDARGWATLTNDYDRVPASAVIHYYRVDRPGQSRGIPDLTPALPLFAQLRRYTLAVLAAAETAADFAGLLYTEAPADDGPETSVELPAIEVEPRMLVPLPEGWRAEQMKAEQPSTTYGDFKREVINEIARCLNMPFNIAAGNSSAYNYASGRMDHQTYFKTICIEQDHIASVVMDRILQAWIDEAILVEGFLPQSARVRGAEFPHQWFWDGHEHVDPVKEAAAQAMRLANCTTTLAAEYARVGRDWEAEVRQRAKEIELTSSLGIPLAGVDSADMGSEDDSESNAS